MNAELRISCSTYRRRWENGRAFYLTATFIKWSFWIQRWAKDGGQPDGMRCPFNRDFTWKVGAR